MALTAEEKATLREEWLNDPLELGVSRSGPRRFAQLLNAPGSASAETYVVDDTPRLVPKSEVMAQMSWQEVVAFRDWREAQADTYAKACKEFWDALQTPDMTHPKVREMIQLLRSLGIIESDESMQAVLRLGERLQARSEELIGRKITEEEAREVIYG